MLDIRVNHQSLDLKLGQKVRFVLSNPIFDVESTARTFSYLFSLDNTPNNNQVLGHPNRLDSATSYISVDARVYLHGVLIADGILELSDVTPDSIEVNIKSKEIELMEEIDTLKIRDLVGRITIPTLRINLEVDENITFYSVTIRGVTISETNPDFGVYTANHYISNKINEIFPGMATPGYFSIFSQFIYLEAVDSLPIDLGELSTGITILLEPPNAFHLQDDFFNFINGLRTNPRPDICFPTVYNPSLYGDNNEGWSKFINLTDEDGEYLQNEVQSVIIPELEGRNIWEYTYIPYVRLPFVLSTILENTSFNSNYHGSVSTRDELQQAVFNNYKTLDFSLNLHNGGTQPAEYLNGFKSVINLREHLPDLSGKDFLLNLLENNAAYIQVQDSTLFINYIQDLLKPQSVDWTDKCEPYWTMSQNPKQGFTLSYPHDVEDDFDTEEHVPSYYHEAAERSIVLPWGIVPSDETTGKIMPKINRLGDTPFPKANDLEKSEPRIFLFKEWQADSEGIFYPQGMSGIAQNGQYINNLQLNGPLGLVKTSRGIIDQLLDAKPLKKQVRLTLTDIIKLQKWEFCKVRMYHEQGEVEAVIKNVEFEADTNGIGIAEVEFVILQP